MLSKDGMRLLNRKGVNFPPTLKCVVQWRSMRASKRAISKQDLVGHGRECDVHGIVDSHIGAHQKGRVNA
jgi:hypothetical protein